MSIKIKKKIYINSFLIALFIGLGLIMVNKVCNAENPSCQVIILPNGKTGFVYEGKEFRFKCSKRRVDEFKVYLEDKETGKIRYNSLSIAGFRDIVALVGLLYIAVASIWFNVYEWRIGGFDSEEEEWEISKELVEHFATTVIACLVIQVGLFFV